MSSDSDEAHLRAIADALLAEAQTGTARPTVSALADRAGITRPTLYRNHPTLLADYLARARNLSQDIAPPPPRPEAILHERLDRLRRENEQLRLHLDLYEEHVRRLTIDNARLREEFERHSSVADLKRHRQRRNMMADS